MKSNILILIMPLLFFTSALNAQCKFKVDENDPFTSEKHLVSRNIKLNGDMKSANEAKFYAITNLELKGESVFWNFQLDELTIRNSVVGKDIKLRVKTSNGFFELQIANTLTPEYTYEGLKMTHYNFTFELTKEQLELMADGVSVVGLEIFNENKIFKDKNNDELTEYAQCMID